MGIVVPLAQTGWLVVEIVTTGVGLTTKDAAEVTVLSLVITTAVYVPAADGARVVLMVFVNSCTRLLL